MSGFQELALGIGGVSQQRRRLATLIEAVGVSALLALSPFRRVRTGYTGALCRLRRSSDNAEADFGWASSSDWLDEAAVLAWAGGGSAFLVSVYDQSGNGLNFTQGTAAKQPRVVNAGVFERIGDSGVAATRPGARYTNQMNLGRTVTWPGGPMSICAVQRIATSSANTNVLLLDGGNLNVYFNRSSAQTDWLVGDGVIKGAGLNTTAAPQSVIQAPGFADGAPHGHFVRLASGGVEWLTDGTAKAARAGTTLGGTVAAANLGLGWGDSFFGNAVTGHLGELVIWAADLSGTQRTAMVANQRAAWGTP